MRFGKALELMQMGLRMKRPAWGGFWEWDSEEETIMIHCRKTDSDTGKDVLDIRETQRVGYTVKNMLAEDWCEATEENCQLLGGIPKFDFETAHKYMKRGLKVKRDIPGCRVLGIQGDEYKMDASALYEKSICSLRPSDLEAKDWTFADQED